MRYLLLFIFFSFPALCFENCVSENLNDLENCSSKNYKEEDLNLNYLYKKVINTYPELKKSIKNTQNIWLKARDDICAYSQVDGREYKVYQNSCLYEQTYERNREIKAIILKQSTRVSSTQNSLWNEYLKSHCSFMRVTYSDSECIARNRFLHAQE